MKLGTNNAHAVGAAMTRLFAFADQGRRATDVQRSAMGQ
jgi:hypothetical protein